METKLNDNEVKEIVKMQQKIDSYEGFIRAAFIMAKSGRHVNYPMSAMIFVFFWIYEFC